MMASTSAYEGKMVFLQGLCKLLRGVRWQLRPELILLLCTRMFVLHSDFQCGGHAMFRYYFYVIFCYLDCFMPDVAEVLRPGGMARGDERRYSGSCLIITRYFRGVINPSIDRSCISTSLIVTWKRRSSVAHIFQRLKIFSGSIGCVVQGALLSLCRFAAPICSSAPASSGSAERELAFTVELHCQY